MLQMNEIPTSCSCLGAESQTHSTTLASLADLIYSHHRIQLILAKQLGMEIRRQRQRCIDPTGLNAFAIRVPGINVTNLDSIEYSECLSFQIPRTVWTADAL
jgi:hypothetical protein